MELSWIAHKIVDAFHILDLSAELDSLRCHLHALLSPTLYDGLYGRGLGRRLRNSDVLAWRNLPDSAEYVVLLLGLFR